MSGPMCGTARPPTKHGRGPRECSRGQLPVFAAASWVALVAAAVVLRAEVPVALADRFAVPAAFFAWVVLVLALVTVERASPLSSCVACWRRIRATSLRPRAARSTY